MVEIGKQGRGRGGGGGGDTETLAEEGEHAIGRNNGGRGGGSGRGGSKGPAEDRDEASGMHERDIGGIV